MTDWNTFNKHVDRLFVKPESKIGKQMHAAVGIAGEAGEILDCVKKTWIYGRELNRENILEECGDLLFYLEAMLIQHGDSIGDLKEFSVPRPIRDIEELVSCAASLHCDCADVLQMVSYYFGNETTASSYEMDDYWAFEIATGVLDILHHAGYTLEECLDYNIDKLANKRYKNGYSDEAALARADKAGEE